MRNKSTTLVLILLAAVALPLPAAAKDSLLTLYSLAKVKDPAIGKAAARVESGYADTEISYAQLLPRADATAGISSLESTTLHYAQGDFSGSYSAYNYGLNIRVPIFQMPSLYSLNASKAYLRGAEAALSGAQQDLIAQLVESYFAVLKGQRDEDYYRGEMKRLALVYDQSREFKKAGVASIVNVFEAKAKMDKAAAELVKAETVRKLSLQQLEILAGRKVSELLDLGAYIPRNPDPADYDWWVGTMTKNRPAIRQATELLTQSELQLKAADAGHLPTLQATGGYSVNKGSTFLPNVETQQWSIGVNLSVPIYSGGETTAKIRKAVAVEAEQRYMLSEAKETGMQKLKQAYMNFDYSAAIIPSLKQQVESASVLLDSVREGRKVSLNTTVDLLNAEQLFANADREYKNALYDNALRNIQLKSAAGILAESDLVGLNVMLAE